jgi:mercuric ion transport protein
MNRKMVKVGAWGTAIAALCCFTPILVVAFGAVGLAAVAGYLDYVLLPGLAIFVALTVIGLVQRDNAT